MTRRADPSRVGLFTVIGIVLLVAAVIAVSGGKVFGRTERAVLNFQGSVWGLQTGAPVVLRGVRVGSVLSVGLVQDAQSGALSAPVLIEVDRRRIRDSQGTDDDSAALPALLRRGLRAKLVSQSLLTGRLFVDMDMGGAPGAPLAAVATSSDPVEIPTVATHAAYHCPRAYDRNGSLRT